MSENIKLYKIANSVSAPTVADNGVYFVKPPGSNSKFKLEIIDNGNKYLLDAEDSYPAIDGNNITDYNNVNKMGRYYITSDALQSAMLNKPSNYSGVLEVTFSSSDSNWIFQRYTEYTGTQSVFHRRFYNGDWTDWEYSWNTLNFNPATKANVNGENTVGGTWKIQLLLSPNLYGDNKQVFSAGGDTIYWGNPTLPYHRFEVKDATTGFNVYDTIRGNKPIWSGHNFDPNTKANTSGYYPGLDVGNSDRFGGYGYKHEDAITNPVFIMTHDAADNLWKPINQRTIADWMRQSMLKINPVGLKSATYGEWFGVVQEASPENPISGGWFNKLKILHQNETGYYTELAQGFGATDGVYYRSLMNGGLNDWKRLWDTSQFSQLHVNNWNDAYANRFRINGWAEGDINSFINTGGKLANASGTVGGQYAYGTFFNFGSTGNEYSVNINAPHIKNGELNFRVNGDGGLGDWQSFASQQWVLNEAKSSILGRNRIPLDTALGQGQLPFWLGLISAGNPLYDYPEFEKGTAESAGMYPYNNTTFTIMDDTSGQSQGKSLKLVTTADGPHGFFQLWISKIQGTYYQIFRALIPVGYELQIHQNAQGIGSSSHWLTDNTGTGKWEWYVKCVYAGNEGEFSSGGHTGITSINGTPISSDNPVTWYITYCQAFEINKHIGTALKAKRLQSAVSLWGVNFDGSSSINSPITIQTPPLDNGTGSFDNPTYGLGINRTNTYYGLFMNVGDTGNSYISSIDKNPTNPRGRQLTLNPHGGNVGIGTSYADVGAKLTISSPDSVENGNNAYFPDGTKLALLNTNLYGTLFYTLGTGVGVIQQQRVDGTPIPYSLSLNPKGGGVKIGDVAVDFDSNALDVYGRIITRGKEGAYVLQFANQSSVNQIVAGTEYRWYSYYWKIGNRRSYDSSSIGFDFELNGVNKVSIAPNSNISTQNYGNSSEWMTAYRSVTLQNVSDLNTGAIGFGVYRQETPDNAYNYTTTLNLNSGDGRQQLMIDRSGAGMMFRGSTTGGADNDTWSQWQHVKTGWSRVVSLQSLAAGQYVGLRLCKTNIGPCRVVITVIANYSNANVGGGNLVKEFSFHDNGIDGFHSWSSRSLSANGSTAEAYRLFNLYVTEEHISTNLYGLVGASLGNPVTIHIDYYPQSPNLAYDRLTPYVTGFIDYDFVMLPDNETALNDGSNTKGGIWKINSVESPQFASTLGVGQIFNAAAGGTLYLGNPTIPLITFETTNAVDFGVYTPTGGRRQIWNGHNFDPSSKVNVSGDNAYGNWGINAYGINAVARGTDDAFRIIPIVLSADNIELEIATADNASEAIVVRQYTGNAASIDTAFQTKVREAYLLDGAGNTSFPGMLSVNNGVKITNISTESPGVVSSNSMIYSVHSTYAYGMSLNHNGGLDIMANQSGQPIRLWSGGTNASPYKTMELNGSGVSVYGGIFTTNYGNSDAWYQAYLWGNHQQYGSHQILGATYVAGGIRTPEDFGAGRLKLEMLSGGMFPGTLSYWQDALWLSAYTGSDVNGSNVLLFGKQNDEIGFARQNFGSKIWGEYRKIWHSGNFDATDVMLRGSAQDVTGHKRFFNSGVEYYDACVELITNNASLVPSLGFHASGRFAGTIKMIDANSFGFYKQGSTGHANLYVGSIVSSGNGNFSNLELSSAQPFIDFHFGSSTADYTSRIGELESGTLSFYANTKFEFNKTVEASGFKNTSLRKYKTNIEPFFDSGLDLVDSLEIVTFDRKDTKEKNVIGVIADDTKQEFLSENCDAVDLYKTIFIQAKAIQELNDKVNKLEELVNKLI